MVPLEVVQALRERTTVLIAVPVGWIVVGVASEDTPVKGQTR
ncbi:hypothetical protein [Streptomyces sp. NPDC002785]